MNELITLEKSSAVTVFTTENGSDPILQKITDEVRKFVPDISTKKGREEVASLAYRVAKSKTYLDDLGASLVEDMKKQVKVVDVSRKKIRDYMDNLKTEVRQPLTDWEEKEKSRLKKFENYIAEIVSFRSLNQMTDSETLKHQLDCLKGITVDDTWEEFRDRGSREKELSIAHVEETLSKRIQYEDEQAELKRLREAEEERKKKEHEERIAKEAAEKVKAEAEAEKQEILRKQKEAQKKAEHEKLEAQRLQKEAEEKAAQEKENSRLAAIKAEKEKKAAADRAREEERQKIQKQKEAEAEATAKREADKEHRRKINNEVLVALTLEAGLSDIGSRKVIEAILTGKIPHTKINY